MTTPPRFTIGQQFVTRGHAPRLCTVTEILRTYNSRGDLVKVRYVATHTFMGETLVDHDVVETTIAMGFIGGSVPPMGPETAKPSIRMSDGLSRDEFLANRK